MCLLLESMFSSSLAHLVLTWAFGFPDQKLNVVIIINCSHSRTTWPVFKLTNLGQSILRLGDSSLLQWRTTVSFKVRYFGIIDGIFEKSQKPFVQRCLRLNGNHSRARFASFILLEQIVIRPLVRDRVQFYYLNNDLFNKIHVYWMGLGSRYSLY